MPGPTIASPVHEPDRNRFSVASEGACAVVDYAIDGHIMTILHTLVPKPLEGRGIAGTLVRAALDFARARGLRVHPSCSYADAWMARHAEYQDLRA